VGKVSVVIIRRTALVLGAFAASTAVAACGGGSSAGSAGSTTPPSPVATQTVTITETPTPTNATTPVSSSSPVTPQVAACTTGQLKLTLGAGQGTAGSTYQPIVFTNTSSGSCSLFGYPGASFVNASGAQLGQPATRDTSTHSVVTLAGGGKASALLRLPDPGVFSPGDCHQTTAARLKVYPPNQTGALLVADAADICTTATGRTSIGPVHSGTNG
jgi:hypothetical protein